MWVSELILGEDHWEMAVELSITETREEAERLSKNATGQKLVMNLGRPSVEVQVGAITHHFYEGDIIILEISKEKRAKMGPPIDVTQPGSIDKITKCLEEKDPAYTIEREDMVPSSLTLADFLRDKGEGYRPDSLAYGAHELTQENCRHVIGVAGAASIRRIDDPNVEAHIRDVQYFVANTARKQVPHPGFFNLMKFCPHCGVELNKEANERAYQEKVAELGGF